MNRFEKLAAINCNDKTERKNGLTYLSWAWAWDQFKRLYPDSYYTIYEGQGGCLYHTDGHTCWVKTGVTLVDGDFSREHIEYLPVMDFKNRSIPLELITSFDANKAIQRSLTKAVARHGLGLYIYAGEDLPEGETEINATPAQPAPPMQKLDRAAPAKVITGEPIDMTCENCGNPIQDALNRAGEPWFASDIASFTKKRFGKALCCQCAKEAKKGA